MKPKLKECGGCNKMTILWKAKRKLPDGTISPALCKECASKQPIQVKNTYKVISNKPKQTSLKPLKVIKLRKAINKVSSKEQKRQAAYLVLRKEYMKQYPECQVRLPECSHVAVDIHHLHFGADRYGHFLDSTSWKSTCRHCHSTLHDKLSNEQLIELGLRLKE